jgi:outer membrane protein assembly factor BamB
MHKLVFLLGIIMLALVAYFGGAFQPHLPGETSTEQVIQEESTSFAVNTAAKKPQNTPEGDWQQYRHLRNLSGRVDAVLPVKPVLSWKIAAGTPIKSAPLVKDDRVFITTQKGLIAAVNLHTGKKLWQYCFCEPVAATGLWLETDEGLHYFIGSERGNFFAVNADSGAGVFSFKTKGPINGGATYYNNDSRKASQVLFGSHDAFLYCLDSASGELIWKLETDNYVNGTPAFVDDLLFLGGCDGFLRAIDPATGSESWAIDLESYIPASPAVEGSVIYVALHDGMLVAIDSKSKKKLWQFKGNQNSEFYTPPVISKNFVVIADADGRVHVINKTDGSLARTVSLAGKVKSEPLADDDSFIIADLDGNIYCYSLTQDKLNWKIQHGSPVAAPLTLIKNGLLVGDLDGFVSLYHPES